MGERTAEQLKHLEFVQNCITRMHDASISMKRIVIVVFALGASLARYLQDSIILLVTLAAVVAFWILDAKYLQLERAFRCLYEKVRATDPGHTASFVLTPPGAKAVPIKELISWSTSLLYVLLLIILFVTWYCTDWNSN